MNGSLEKHLNVFGFYRTTKEKAEFTQLDLLLPIIMKESVKYVR